ncbi:MULTISPECIES: hypothetical protein [unclassified Brevibacterium]|nr:MULTISPECIES: hypothetical protein [unclassified Brevibacterium]
MTLTIPTINFADGTPVPLVGLGTYGLQGNPGADAVASAPTRTIRSSLIV